jgi:hypothetical protein
MQDLNFPLRTADNFGGLDRFWFLPESAVQEVDDNGMVVLKEGAVWYLGKATRYTLDFSCPARERRGGTLFEPRLQGLISRHTPELEAVLKQLRGQRFILIYKDRNGYLNQVGIPGEALRFESEQVTGDTPAAKNGVRFTFSGSTRQEPVYYNREITTGTPGDGSSTDGPPVTIKINGNVVALRDPGTTYEFFSDFTHEFTIEQQ